MKVDELKLTNAEAEKALEANGHSFIDGVCMNDGHHWDAERDCSDHRLVADAATAKALRGVVAWLRSRPVRAGDWHPEEGTLASCQDQLGSMLMTLVDAAGIARPEAVAK